MRVDKWIWAVRMVKSRTLAGEFCKGGKVKVNGETAKASKTIKTGDIVEVIFKGGFIKKYEVVKFLEKRAGAKLAQECFKDLSPQLSEDEKLERKYQTMPIGRRKKGEGRPTKKERRDLDKFRENLF